MSIQRCYRARGGFTLIELMIVVAILGILAVVAIPAFVRYMRVAKTAEVYRNLAKIQMGVTQYFISPKVDDAGQPLPCQFPRWPVPIEPSNMTPPAGTCCSDGEADGKCEPNETRWDTDAWRATLFKISDKHYYSYGVDGALKVPGVSDGGVEAVGDLDCDGTYASFGFKLRGKSNPGSPHLNCRVKAESMQVYMETE